MGTESFSRAKETAEKLGIRNVLVATNTGQQLPEMLLRCILRCIVAP